MGSFANHAFFHTSQTIEDDCSVSTSYIVHRCLGDGDTDEDGDGPSPNSVEGGRRRHFEIGSGL